MRRLLLALLLGALAVSGFGTEVQAGDLVIGYLEFKKDPRYGERRSFARYLAQPLGRPYAGAEVALREIRFHGAATGVDFKLERVAGGDTGELVAAVDRLSGQGARFFVVDAPADTVAAVAEATQGRELLLFNVSAREDRLRQEHCQSHLLHVIPSDAMLMDALTQYLVFRKWKEVLVLVGPLAEDGLLAAAFERAARRYGARIADRRRYVLGADPRERERNNVALLTAGVDYDVVFVADSDGEFAREVPYQTQLPRPVVGTEGLAAVAWHWAWERHGAPQLERRFEKRAGRPMTGVDWAAWIAVKAVAEAVQRTGSSDFPTLRSYLLGPDLVLDGFKGNRLNFRPWDRQLRQPLLIVTHNWVVERAPIRGFLHASNNMDTLGFDERDSRCRF